MAKMLRCKDVGMECGFEVCGKDEAEVMAKGAEHAREVHDKTEFTPEEMEMIRARIIEVESCPHVPRHSC